MTAWFICSFDEDVNAKPTPIRWCQMDKFTGVITRDGGTWEEIEFGNNQALVKVSATKKTLDLIKKDFTDVTNKLDAYQTELLTRIPPRFDQQTKKIVFDNPPVENKKTLNHVDSRVT